LFISTFEKEQLLIPFTLLYIDTNLLNHRNIAICSKFPSGVTSLQLVTECSHCGILACDTVHYFQWTQPFRTNKLLHRRVLRLKVEGVQDSAVVRCDFAQLGNKFMTFFCKVHKRLHSVTPQNTPIFGHITMHTSKLARRMCLA
jgi:hypothetical protein